MTRIFAVFQGAPVAANNADEDSDPEPSDEVRLWEDGFKDRYYSSKFDSKPKNLSFRIKLAHEYVRGLSWVLQYYYQVSFLYIFCIYCRPIFKSIV
jgi:5'-3' exonuclease